MSYMKIQIYLSRAKTKLYLTAESRPEFRGNSNHEFKHNVFIILMNQWDKIVKNSSQLNLHFLQECTMI